MAGENHLTYFKVQNFKRFKELEVKDIGQFNLVLGDNNVGKTSFLEALLFTARDDFKSFSRYLLYALRFKSIGDSLKVPHWSFFVRQPESSERVMKLEFQFELGDGEKQQWGLDYDFVRNEMVISSDQNKGAVLSGFYDFKSLGNGILAPFIPYSYSYGSDLADYYEENVQGDWQYKEKLTEAIKVMVPSVRGFESSKRYSDRNSLVFWETSRNSAVPLSMYGEGTTKLFRILTDIVIYRRDILMIDEIDTGIHYSRMKDFWKTILLAAKENDVQLFATTHNLECIRYFKEALEEIELAPLQGIARSITLVEHPTTKEISAHTFSFAALEHSVEAGNEIRGF